MKAQNRRPLLVGTDRQLFIDERFIERSDGITLAMNPPQKHPVPLLVADRPWESMMISAWSTVMRENGTYRMWYGAFDSEYTDDYGERLCYATSKDGIHWEKLELGLLEFKGSRANNIVFANDGNGYHGGSVFVDPNDRPDRRYKLIFISKHGTRPEHWNQCVSGAWSADGIHWTAYPRPLADHLSDTQNVAIFDSGPGRPGLGRYVGFFRTWSGGDRGVRQIGRSETADFERWPRDAETVLSPDADDPPDMDFYNNAYLRYPFAADAHFMFISAYYHVPDTLDVQLATSRDGIRWHRPDRRPFLRLGPEGAWDGCMIYAGVGLAREGDLLAMYYGGYRHRHQECYPHLMSYAGGIGRATMRLDGYMSADAGYAGGIFTTPPLSASGDRLELNVDSGAGGWVKVGLQNDRGEAIPGLSMDDCDTLCCNSTARKVTWKGKREMAGLSGKPVRLVFRMRDAKLYSFCFGSG